MTGLPPAAAGHVLSVSGQDIFIDQTSPDEGGALEKARVNGGDGQKE